MAKGRKLGHRGRTAAPLAARREAGDLEDEVLAALCSTDAPLTAGEVQRLLDRELAYTTVLTTLSRLHAKGTVERTKVGRAHAYHPVLDRAERTAGQMRRLLSRPGDREAVLARFVEGLTKADERILRRLFDEHQP